MKVNKSFNLSAIELMDALREELLNSCIYHGDNAGYSNLSGEEERHLLALWEVIKPLGTQVEAAKNLKFVVDQINRKVLEDH